jgi:hypothetical protein
MPPMYITVSVSWFKAQLEHELRPLSGRYRTPALPDFSDNRSLCDIRTIQEATAVNAVLRVTRHPLLAVPCDSR